MATSLAEDIREGFEGVRSSAADDRPAQLVSRARDRSLGVAARDQTLGEVVRAYRAGDKAVWGPVLLELLAPAIMKRLVRFEPVEPVFTAEDIRQQLVYEVLSSASTMPMPAKARYFKARIMKRAAQDLDRWLAREGRRQTRQELFTDERDKSL